MQDHGRFMREALEEAAKALGENEVPVGAVLVGDDGEILARAHNQSISLADPTGHAEMLALRRAAERVGNYRLIGTTLYVTVEPCPMCAGALIWARVRRLVYGVRDAKGGAVESLYRLLEDKRLNHTVEVVSGVMEGECRALMQRFFRGLRVRSEDADGDTPGS